MDLKISLPAGLALLASAVQAKEPRIQSPAPGGRNALGSAVLKTRHDTYRGAFVIYYHDLRHEDQGMTQIVGVM